MDGGERQRAVTVPTSVVQIPFLWENESRTVFLKSSLHHEHALSAGSAHTAWLSCLRRLLCSSPRNHALSFTTKTRAATRKEHQGGIPSYQGVLSL